ncbi:ABC transporter permease [Pseudohoeflea coraliihabitans]|uniref:Iron ABC transporter permease n=1 Tax=Pseudohoeflea coraliihabitans TaxID=2860393 RepID=A0ABS6WLK9_9HYPH|nr:iron ABC transporter permease [Pseudohoeflea sp. DP4N28-3]MBW3095954.1 iron ABC transporter permease [Pseudohoeflea sp. DP4N28-3]
MFGERALKTAAWVISLICLAPILAVAIAAASGTLVTWNSLAGTVLPGYAVTTLLLVILVGIGTAVIGTGAAWLVSVCAFPFRRTFEIALALPLAFPAYVLAYAYTDLLDHPGPVQTWLRTVTGWGPRDYWFPEIRSLGGAAAMLTFVLYPYVYLLARAAFLRQSPTAYFAARTLGHPPWSAFLRVSLPMARPAIAGGVILALMETIADFGTVAHFGVQTFATGIYRAWFSMGDRLAASQLALCLLAVALLFATLERAQRGLAKRYPAGSRFEASERHVLTGGRAALAFAACALPVLVGFAIPLVVLIDMAVSSGHDWLSRRYVAYIENSLTLAAIAAALTVAAAVLIGFCARIAPSRAARFAAASAGIGYAVPGGVIAVGLLVPFAHLDNAIDDFAEAVFGVSTGLLFTGSIGILVIAYMVRFIAAALGAFDTGISVIRPNIDAAARTLGRTAGRMLWQIHLPLLRPSLLTALLIVFVDVMKELPATLIMRPFNFDTLAVQAYRLASDERLNQAAIPSLMIVAFGLMPVILLCYSIGRSGRPRAGQLPSEDGGVPAV